jgi:hypothetical protein
MSLASELIKVDRPRAPLAYGLRRRARAGIRSGRHHRMPADPPRARSSSTGRACSACRVVAASVYRCSIPAGHPPLFGREGRPFRRVLVPTPAKPSEHETQEILCRRHDEIAKREGRDHRLSGSVDITWITLKIFYWTSISALRRQLSRSAAAFRVIQPTSLDSGLPDRWARCQNYPRAFREAAAPKQGLATRIGIRAPEVLRVAGGGSRTTSSGRPRAPDGKCV